MSLSTVTTGNTILAADVNQLVNVLQRASGQTEAGKYFLAGPAYASNAVVALYMPTLSRNATPVSVTIDTVDQAPAGGMGTVQSGQLTANGFQIFSINSTGPNTNCRAGGNWTVQY